jgi:hypothetical protein
MLVRLLHDLADLRDLINAHERVHLGEQLGQFLAEALRQAAGDDQPLTTIAGLAHFGGFEDRVHAFLLRGINEGTRVDDHDVGLGGVIRDLDAVLEQRAEHDLGVHQIFGATERDQPDLQRVGRVFSLCHRTTNLSKAAGRGNLAFRGQREGLKSGAISLFSARLLSASHRSSPQNRRFFTVFPPPVAKSKVSNTRRFSGSPDTSRMGRSNPSPVLRQSCPTNRCPAFDRSW